MRRTFALTLALLFCFLALAGCGGKETAPAAPVPTETPAPEETPVPTEAPGSGSEVPKESRETYPEMPDWLSLPEGAEWLSDRELAEWGAWFSMDFMRDQFMYSTYHSPQDIDIMQTFYNGGPAYQVVDMTDVRAFLLKYGTWNVFTDVLKLSAEEIDGTLKDYAGITLAETNGVGMYMLSYVPETDCYYAFRGDTNRSHDPIFEYGWREGDTAVLFYQGSCTGDSRYLTGLFRITLEETPEGWRFLANEFCEMRGSWVDYVAEPDPWHPEPEEIPVELSLPEEDPALSAGDRASAGENILALLEAGSVRDAGDNAYSDPGYDVLWGTLEGETAVFFIAGDGTVVPLPVRGDPEPESLSADRSPLLLMYTWSRAEETGGYGVNSCFLIPTGELFVSEFHW